EEQMPMTGAIAEVGDVAIVLSRASRAVWVRWADLVEQRRGQPRPKTDVAIDDGRAQRLEERDEMASECKPIAHHQRFERDIRRQLGAIARVVEQLGWGRQYGT